MRRERVVAAAAAATLLAGIVSAAHVDASPAPPKVHAVKQVLEVPSGPTTTGTVRLPTTTYYPERTPAPAVVVSPGFGQTEGSVADDARYLAQHGYVAVTWTLRGFQPFNTQGGRIALDAPDTEVQDLRRLLDRLAADPKVTQDAQGDPRVGLMGESYGGGISLMGASYDTRVDAIVPVITWSSLRSSLAPGGVFKAEYASVFFALAARDGCSRFAARVCRTYEHLAVTGVPDAQDQRLLDYSSPRLDAITAPTLLVQGEDDTLFPLTESLRTAEALQRKGTPVALRWLSGGHDRSFGVTTEARIRRMAGTWFDCHLRKRKVSTGPLFTWHRSSGGDGASSHLPTAAPASVTLERGSKTITNPAGGRPASISSLPGAGAVSGLAGALGFDFPGQSASWVSPALPETREILGAGRFRVNLKSSTGEAVLFAKVYDVAPDGSATLPNGQIAPLRTRSGAVTVDLPALAHVVPAGHRIRVQVSTTDLGYAGPLQPASYELSDPELSLPLVPLSKGKGYGGLALVAGLIALGLLLIGAYLWARRHRKAPDLGEPDATPVVIRGLAKTYADGFRAVDGVDLTVEKGMLLGLLGPNGAGKTTTLRMLAGLITPTAGSVEVFGRPVSSGAAVLNRVGIFIEGPGLLPHLSGMENLRLYWTSVASSMEGSFVEEALDIAGLGDAVHRPVRTYSHGMKQRLAIAQAMLGMPDLLVLDEPTNGLDPPQIKEVREVLQRIAASGRTVLVSSHLLSEVEQMCSHVAVMSKGRMVAQGTVAELIAGQEATHLEVDDPERALQVLAAAGIEVTTVAGTRRLEDVFFELTGTGS